MDLDDVRKGGAFRRIHNFGAPLASFPKPSTGARVWMPQPGQEIFLHFEPNSTSFIQNRLNPPETITGIRNFAYHQNLDVTTHSFSGGSWTYTGGQPYYVEFELEFEQTFGGSVVLAILADAVSSPHINLDRDKLQGLFVITQVDLEMRIS